MLTQFNLELIPKDKYKKMLLERRSIEGECWIYPSEGIYGQVHVNEIGTWIQAHRLSLLVFKPEEFSIELNANHKCDNKRCVNPEHLYSGTQAQNRLDYTMQITHCPFGHPYENNFYRRKNGGKVCKTCQKRRAAVTRAVNKEKRK